MEFCPLISLKTCGHENYFLWIEEVEKISFMLKVTDGYQVWEQSIQAGKNKPKSRKESDDEYIDIILTYLQDLDTDKRDYGITITASGSLQFMIKERLGSMMALLLKLDMTENFDATTAIRGILNGACNACAKSTTSLLKATKEIQLNREANDSLTQTIHSYAKSKEEFQNDFFKKLTIVLNSKKREIRRLLEEVGALEDEVSSLRAKASRAASKKKPKLAPKSKAKKSKVAKRDESEEEEEEEVLSEESDEGSATDEDDYSIQTDNDNTQGSLSENTDDEDTPISPSQNKPNARIKTSTKSKTRAAASCNKRKPPSYTQQPSQGLLKKRKTTTSQSQSQSASQSQSQSQSQQIISQVLAPTSGATETTGSDLTRILAHNKGKSQSTRNSRVIADTQEEEEEETGGGAATKSSYKYAAADDSDDEDFCVSATDGRGGGGEVEKASAPAPAPAAKKKRRNACDRLFNNDSSSSEEEEEGSLMDFL